MIDVHYYATCDAQLQGSNIIRQITSYWDIQIIKSLLFLRPALDTGVEFEVSRVVEEIQASKAETTLKNSQPKRRKYWKKKEILAEQKISIKVSVLTSIELDDDMTIDKQNQCCLCLKQQSKLREKEGKTEK